MIIKTFISEAPLGMDEIISKSDWDMMILGLP
jgi:hypothetical protein